MVKKKGLKRPKMAGNTVKWMGQLIKLFVNAKIAYLSKS